MKKRKDNEKGIALLIVMTTVALLSIVLAEFTYDIKLNKIKIFQDQNRAQAKLLAESGLNFALAKLKIYKEAKNFLEDNESMKKNIKPEIIESVILLPFIYPLPELPGADPIAREAITEFSESIVLDGSFNVEMKPVTGFYNVNAMRLVKSKDDKQRNERDINDEQNQSSDQLPPHEFVEKELIQLLKNEMESKRVKDENFDALYGHLDPELLIKELKFYVTDKGHYKDGDIGEYESKYDELEVRPKYAALGSKEELYMLAGWNDEIVDLIKSRISVNQNTVVYVDKMTGPKLKALFPELAEEHIEEYFKIINGSEENGTLPFEIKTVDDFKNVLVEQIGAISEEQFDKRAKEFASAGIKLGLEGKLFIVKSVGKFQDTTYTLEAVIDMPTVEIKVKVKDPNKGEDQDSIDFTGENESQPETKPVIDKNKPKTKTKIKYLEPRIVELTVS